jgi:hypothetical protein
MWYLAREAEGQPTNAPWDCASCGGARRTRKGCTLVPKKKAAKKAAPKAAKKPAKKAAKKK